MNSSTSTVMEGSTEPAARKEQEHAQGVVGQKTGKGIRVVANNLSTERLKSQRLMTDDLGL